MSNGTYMIPVWDTITTSWEKVSGSKKTFWASLIIVFAIMFALGFIQGLLGKDTASAHVIQTIGQVLAYFLQMGLLYMGIKRAADLPIHYQQVFYALKPTVLLKIALLYVIQIVIFIPVILLTIFAGYASTHMIGAPAFIVPVVLAIGAIICLYLAMRLYLSYAMILDRNVSPWQAVKLSFKASRCNVLRILCLLILQMIILFISALPLGIGLIWTLPLVLICYGLIYHRLIANAETVTTTSTTI